MTAQWAPRVCDEKFGHAVVSVRPGYREGWTKKSLPLLVRTTRAEPLLNTSNKFSGSDESRATRNLEKRRDNSHLFTP